LLYSLHMESLIALLPPVTPQTIYIYAVVGGFLPPLLWLSFFLREDKKNPEPKRVILGSFLFGCISAIFAIPFQGLFAALFPTATLLLLHIISSVFVGISLTLSYGKRKNLRPILLPIGIVCAIGFHSLFNILVTGSGSKSVFFGFALVWGTLIVLLIGLEFLKDYIRDYLQQRELEEKLEQDEPLVSNPFGKLPH